MSGSMVEKREQVVAAALGVFGRYGYRRTSIDLIAQAARMSRPAVYQHFKNKEEIFRAVGQLIGERVTAAAHEAGKGGRPVADRLFGALVVKLDLFAGTIDAEFRAELFSEAAGIAQDIVRAFEDGYRDVVEAVLLDCADELDLLGHALSARDAATLLLDALAGITQAREEPEILHARLRQLVELTVRGLTGTPEKR
ncbi:TetR/AcrR family transcriptional regulator [Actinoallomurus purpureus]|uniref:TetR/AcrR family transcriptional regulator n=1 Tax=Actinoallomurus purpureus TaxID=478114 RepID=UPI002093370F|nr:TetR/AcrR family transcriptional regulator [Actinoallomurus purpureus]MCO6011254.1 TetR/AcrR family transcriptional regulator [Actinoallomurus purpureus]